MILIVYMIGSELDDFYCFEDMEKAKEKVVHLVKTYDIRIRSTHGNLVEIDTKNLMKYMVKDQYGNNFVYTMANGHTNEELYMFVVNQGEKTNDS